MGIGAILSERNTLIDMPAPSKAHLLSELCSHAAKAVGLDAEAISCEIRKRESLGSTGIGGGVAIPHARIPRLARAFGMLVRLQRPIDFNAVDEKPVDVVFVLLLPAAETSEHLSVLAAVARKLRDAGTLHDLRQARDASALYRIMTAQSPPP